MIVIDVDIEVSSVEFLATIDCEGTAAQRSDSRVRSEEFSNIIKFL